MLLWEAFPDSKRQPFSPLGERLGFRKSFPTRNLPSRIPINPPNSPGLGGPFPGEDLAEWLDCPKSRTARNALRRHPPHTPRDESFRSRGGAISNRPST
jgi:hypothetical protein